MRSWWKTLALIATATALLLGFFKKPMRPEPMYERQTLTEWLEITTPRPDTYLPTKADKERGEHAVRNIGTNAIPFLLCWIAAHNPPWRGEKPEWLLSQMPAPFYRLRPLVSDQVARKHQLALNGFRILGPTASAAVPALTRCMNDSDAEDVADAMAALGHLGQAGLGPLMITAADSRSPHRAAAIDTIAFSLANGTVSHEAVDVLLRCCSDADPNIAEDAADAVARIVDQPTCYSTEEISAALQPYVKLLHRPDPQLRVRTLLRISLHGTNAHMIANEIASIKEDPEVGEAATEALSSVAPELVHPVQ